MNALLPTLFGAVLAPALLGAGIVGVLGLSPRHGWRLFAAWSYLAGQFALAWGTFAWLAGGWPVPGWYVPTFAAAAGVVLLVLCERRARRRAAPTRRPGDVWLRAVLAVLVAVVIERSAWMSSFAILGSDEANIWAAKARVLCAPGDLSAWLHGTYAQHPDYPLLDPLMQVLAFASSGGPLLWENRLPLQAASVALLLLLSVVVERRLPRWLAAAVLVAFASTVFLRFAPTVYADVLLSFALLAAMQAWLQWRATGERVWWRLGCVAAAAMLATKNEGAMLCVAVVLAAASVRFVAARGAWPRLGAQWWWIVVPVATAAAGWWFDAHHGLVNDLAGPDAAGRGLFARAAAWLPQRAWPVLAHYARLLADPAAMRWLVLAMLLAPIAAGRTALRCERSWPWLAVVFALGGYMLVFVGTTADQGGPDGPARGLLWHLETAADRTVLHVLPLAVLALAACLGRGGANDESSAHA